MSLLQPYRNSEGRLLRFLWTICAPCRMAGARDFDSPRLIDRMVRMVPKLCLGALVREALLPVTN
jgi:hypothetical protein